MMSEWVKENTNLFTETKTHFEYAYFGWGNPNQQWYGYTEGYKQSADILVDYAIQSKRNKTLDTFVYPICFMYRQYVELKLKSIFLRYSDETKEEKVKFIQNVQHNLEKIWKRVKRVLEENSNDEEKKDIEIAEGYILQYHVFDKDSFSFRYPINKRLDVLHEKWEYLDIKNLKIRMNEIYNFLETADTVLRERKKSYIDSLLLFSEDSIE